MCGFIGVATTRPYKHALSQKNIVRLRAMLEHRGPDSSGLFHTAQLSVGFQRLAILDPEHGEQPFLWFDHSYKPHNTYDKTPDMVLVFNGEIYNHLELRKKLKNYDDRPFQSECDSETLGRLLYAKEERALDELRGMFSFAAWWPKKQKLMLARDPYGMKPLYYGMIATDRVHDQAGIETHPEIIFASEPGPILAHPDVEVQPNWPVVSSYLSTLRTTMGSQTLFKGLFTLEPGELLVADLSGNDLNMMRKVHKPDNDDQFGKLDNEEEAQAALRHHVNESIEAHQLSSVPIATMLSGGLDSTVISTQVSEKLQQEGGQLKTFAAGSDPDSDDPLYARLAASQLRTHHHEVMIDKNCFLETWPLLIRKTRLPVGTPNEIAIYHLGRHIQEHARVVLSGEGADEMFAGYEPPLATTLQYLTQLNQVGIQQSGTGNQQAQQLLPSPQNFYTQLISWIPPQHKANVFSPAIHKEIEDDYLLHKSVHQAFSSAGDPTDFRSHLKVHRHFNLTGLLQRLDQCLMLSGVEGRTPYADRNIESLADHLPLNWLFSPLEPISNQNSQQNNQVEANAPIRYHTKRLLRKAYAHQVPDEISTRPKASFPLPFQQWLPQMTPLLKNSEVLHQTLSPGIMTALTQGPSGLGIAAWPLANIGLWLMQWE